MQTAAGDGNLEHPVPMWFAAAETGVAVAIRSSLQLSAEDMMQLEQQLAASRNRFVSLQLVTMVREQLAKNCAAAAAGDSQSLRQAAFVFIATATVDGRLVGGALFYPRLSKPSGYDGKAEAGLAPDKNCALLPAAAPVISLTVRAGPAAEEPSTRLPALPGAKPAAAAAEHDQAAPQPKPMSAPTAGGEPAMAAADQSIYIELICVNAPGKGYGSLLLQNVERFVKCNAWQLQQCHPQADAITGVRLLSVSSAQRFYASLGYGEPDEGQEMFKPISALS